MIDLNTLIPANSNLYLLDASTINDLGEIVGYAYDETTGNLPLFWRLFVVTATKRKQRKSVQLPKSLCRITSAN